MTLSRRDLALLFPALAAAQQSPAAALPSKIYHSARIPYTGDDHKKGRQFFHAAEHSGFQLESHETVLGPGTQTHEPHKHEHDEIITLIEGTLETYIEGKTEIAEAGSGFLRLQPDAQRAQCRLATPARYYVIELRGRQA